MTPAAEAPILNLDVIDKLQFLFEPHRYKVVYGGRGGVKSWSVAQALVVQGLHKPLRIVCGRETQSSIRESVHQLLSDRIRELGLDPCYEVLQYEIRTRKDYNLRVFGDEKKETVFIFTGLREKEIRSIKSLEAADILWIEEAAGITPESWRTIVPTIRKQGSEIWLTFNPETEHDQVYREFILNQHPDAKVCQTFYYENPWLPETMRRDMEHMKHSDPAAFRHVWLGECRSTISGAIYEHEMQQAQADGRIASVPVDRTKPVDTFWDLGFGDDTAIWFAQAVNGWYYVVDYLESRSKTIEWYLIQLQQKGYLYGTDWLPFDSVDAQLHKRLQGDTSRSIEMILRGAGRNLRVVPKLAIMDGINAARTIFPQCRFDSEKCARGLHCLRMYQWGPPVKVGENKVERSKPLHDFASHAADAFRVLALALKEQEPERLAVPEEQYYERARPGSWMR